MQHSFTSYTFSNKQSTNVHLLVHSLIHVLIYWSTDWFIDCCYTVEPGQREAVDRSLIQRAGIDVTAGRGGAGGQRGKVSQRPGIAPPPMRAAPAAPRQAPRPSANTTCMCHQMTTTDLLAVCYYYYYYYYC